MRINLFRKEMVVEWPEIETRWGQNRQLVMGKWVSYPQSSYLSLNRIRFIP